jgi:anti-anti-sigma regulatory factor
MEIGPIILDCASLVECDAKAVDVIARIQLAVRQCGGRVKLVNVRAPLVELIDLCGLTEALGVEVRREVEEGKQAGCVEEEGDLSDPAP